MELGATVCVPNTEPRCGDCPISNACLARQAVLRYEREGGDAVAAGAPRVTDYPTKVRGAAGRGACTGSDRLFASCLLLAHDCLETS